MDERRYYYLLGLFFSLDIFFKYIIDLLNIDIRVLSFFNIILVKNTGISFGLLKGYNMGMIIISLAAAAGLVELMRRYADLRIGLAAILAGAAGNIVDRVVRGYVVDYISLSFWPAFNISDMLVVIGAGYLLYQITFEK